MTVVDFCVSGPEPSVRVCINAFVTLLSSWHLCVILDICNVDVEVAVVCDRTLYLWKRPLVFTICFGHAGIAFGVLRDRTTLLRHLSFRLLIQNILLLHPKSGFDQTHETRFRF